MPGLDELSNEKVDAIAATEVMGSVPSGYVLHKDANFYATQYEGLSVWRPTTDRNQSRYVVEAAAKKVEATGRGAWWMDSELFALIGNHDHPSPIWRIVTPRQEVIAAILAVRDLEGVRDLP